MEMPLPTQVLPTQVWPAAQLLARKRTAIRLRPEPHERAAIARALGLLDLPAFSFEAEVVPEHRGDLKLTGRLKAEVIQPCVLTLVPVRTKLDEPVLRRFLSDWVQPEGEETEIPEDDSAEPMTATIDMAALAIEALALALPEYPRARGAALGAQEFPPPGPAAPQDRPPRPLAGLAALLSKKSGGD